MTYVIHEATSPFDNSIYFLVWEIHERVDMEPLMYVRGIFRRRADAAKAVERLENWSDVKPRRPKLKLVS